MRILICAICKEKAKISTYTKFRIFTLTIAPSTKPPSPFSSSGWPLTAPDLLFLVISKWLCKLDLGLFEAILLKFPAKCVCMCVCVGIRDLAFPYKEQTIQIWISDRCHAMLLVYFLETRRCVHQGWSIDLRSAVIFHRASCFQRNRVVGKMIPRGSADPYTSWVKVMFSERGSVTGHVNLNKPISEPPHLNVFYCKPCRISKRSFCRRVCFHWTSLQGKFWD